MLAKDEVLLLPSGWFFSNNKDLNDAINDGDININSIGFVYKKYQKVKISESRFLNVIEEF